MVPTHFCAGSKLADGSLDIHIRFKQWPQVMYDEKSKTRDLTKKIESPREY